MFKQQLKHYPWTTVLNTYVHNVNATTVFNNISKTTTWFPQTKSVFQENSDPSQSRVPCGSYIILMLFVFCCVPRVRDLYNGSSDRSLTVDLNHHDGWGGFFLLQFRSHEILASRGSLGELPSQTGTAKRDNKAKHIHIHIYI